MTRLDGVSIAEAARAAGVCRQTVYDRLAAGKSLEQVLAPRWANFPRYDFRGELLRFGELAQRAVVPPATLKARLRRGWPPERAALEPTKAGGSR